MGSVGSWSAQSGNGARLWLLLLELLMMQCASGAGALKAATGSAQHVATSTTRALRWLIIASSYLRTHTEGRDALRSNVFIS